MDILRQVGGWDPWNVTEDADLGYRLWRRGWRLGVMSSPTWETPPGDLHAWLPQRTRWLKGFMQTWLVHMRRPLSLGWRGLLSLHLTLGLALVAAALHAAALALLLGLTLSALIYGLAPATPPLAVLVLVTGASSSWFRPGSAAAGRASVRPARHADGAPVLVHAQLGLRPRLLAADPPALRLGQDPPRPG
ncbi:glycosyltransferase family 2 protein [Brevundimonas denitrificans]|uniref:glycosyltransferase family 2 protein n=1 Tax=Brevundimonas denitrificans TaxID=1443434 RepID=UPI00223C16D8|nr:glycosyltransferase family 2 protein [Brevundimonas denitrificans]